MKSLRLTVVLLCAAGISCFAIFGCDTKNETTSPDPVVAVTPTPIPEQCKCSKGKVLIKQGGTPLSPPVVRPFEWYMASATQWFNSDGQVLPESCSWNQFTIWEDIINGGCKLYDGAGDPERALWCTTGSDAVKIGATANIGGAMCRAETTFRVSRDDF